LNFIPVHISIIYFSCIISYFNYLFKHMYSIIKKVLIHNYLIKLNLINAKKVFKEDNVQHHMGF
jgi:hypothetical protein